MFAAEPLSFYYRAARKGPREAAKKLLLTGEHRIPLIVVIKRLKRGEPSRTDAVFRGERCQLEVSLFVRQKVSARVWTLTHRAPNVERTEKEKCFTHEFSQGHSGEK